MSKVLPFASGSKHINTFLNLLLIKLAWSSVSVVPMIATPVCIADTLQADTQSSTITAVSVMLPTTNGNLQVLYLNHLGFLLDNDLPTAP